MMMVIMVMIMVMVMVNDGNGGDDDGGDNGGGGGYDSGDNQAKRVFTLDLHVSKARIPVLLPPQL